MGKTLILKDASVDWEQYYSENMRNSSIDVETPYKKMGKMGDFICHVFMHFDFLGFSFFFGGWKKRLKEYNTVIIFDRLYSQNVIPYIKKHNKNARIIFWYWNIIETNFKKPRYPQAAEYWTFDTRDAQKYQMNKNIQFYFRRDKQTILECKYDVFFVGSDKGRAAELRNFEKKLRKAGYKTCFKIIRDKTSKDGIEYSDYLRYSEVLSHIRQSRCILDFCQSAQSGLTLRPLEALYYNKLLITNNSEIKQYDFYSPNNIAVMPEEADTLIEFLKHEYQPLSENIMGNHDYYAWLKNFDIEGT